MFSLETQIEPYIAESFSAEEAAQNFFSVYGESDISKKLNEMSNIQQSIETVLRQKVRSNYGMFLLANEEINQVDEEMSDLKHLILNTQKLIDDVQSNRLAESTAMQTNSYLIADSGDDVFASYHNATEAKSNMPSWLLKAPENLAQFIVEQQFAKAVVIVLRTRAYVDTISKDRNQQPQVKQNAVSQQNRSNVGSSVANTSVEAETAAAQTAALLRVLDMVDGLCAHLAITIKKSILNLPNSSLWGRVEQSKLLKLLIALEEFNMAVDGFATTKASSIKKLLLTATAMDAATTSSSNATSVVSSNDPVGFAVDLSTSFFGVLMETLQSFRSLFDVHFDRPEILNLLLSWIQQQVTSYVEVLTTQIRGGLIHQASLVLSQLRRIAGGGTTTTAAPAPATTILYGNQAVIGSSPRSSISAARKSISVVDTDGANAGSSTTKQYEEEQSAIACAAYKSVMQDISGRGALSMLSCCLDAAYSSASSSIDLPQLQGSACLGWMLVPHAQQFVTLYAEQFIEQIEAQVRQDSWEPVYMESLTVPSPVGSSSSVVVNDSCGAIATVSRSYEWLLAAITHFTAEVWALLKASEQLQQSNTSVPPDSSSSNSSNITANIATITKPSSSYSRADICEVEPVAVSCIMRILLRYVVESESMSTKGFTKMQITCYINTIQAIVDALFPSVLSMLQDCSFYSEDSTAAAAAAIGANSTSPQIILKMVAPRLLRLIRNKKEDANN